MERDAIPVTHFQLIDATNGNSIPLGHLTDKGFGVISDKHGYLKMLVTKR
jgi:hypothetical protein